MIAGLRFYDRDKSLIYECIGKNRSGKWFDITIRDDEHIIGATVLIDTELKPRPRAISFTLYKP